MARTPRPPGPSGKEVEQTYGDSGCKCAHYRKFFPDGDGDGCSVSDHSPGAVTGDESLYRFLQPDDFEEGTLKISTGALREVESLGLSVIRGRYVSLEGLEHRALGWAKRRRLPLSDLSLARARCGDIKAIMLSGKKGYSVYDTATGLDPAHADICRALTFPSGTPDQKSLFRELRLRLSEAFTVTLRFIG